MATTNGAKALHLPVIDISKLDGNTGDELVAAAAEYGFVFIKSTKQYFSGGDIDEMFKLARSFFHSSPAQKERCAMQKNNRGWTAMHEEVLDPKNQKTGDFKEAFNFGEFVNGKAQQPLSGLLATREASVNFFSELCRDLCLDILRLFALGLKIPPSEGGSEWFSSRHDYSKGPSGTILRLLYYPTQPLLPNSPAPDDIRAGAHSDYGSMTLLFRLPGQAGLEILTPDQKWEAVPVIPPGTENDPFPPILINIGDLLSYWTGGLLKSTIHRVVFPRSTANREAEEGWGAGEERYSIAYFFHPCKTTPLVPVPSEMVAAKAKDAGMGGEKVLTAMEHLEGRLAATYGWETNGEAS